MTPDTGPARAASPGAAPTIQPAAGPAAAPCGPICSHAIGTRLSKKLAMVTMLVLGLLSVASWFSIHSLVVERNGEDVARRCALIAGMLELQARNGGEPAVLAWLRHDAAMRGDTRLQVWRADGSVLHADAMPSAMVQSSHVRAHDFDVTAPALSGGRLAARLEVDYARDAAMGTRWMWVLALTTLGAGGVVAAASYFRVRRELRPLRELAAQAKAISPQRLDLRLALPDPAEELLPFIEQFNALMQRLERAYAQLEAFNADVAHELRTPLATLIGQTELALSRDRSAEALRDTLVSNLEETQRLTTMVNDMLFLAQADRGAAARRGAPVSLAGLAQQVVEFHEAALEDAGLALRIEGDVVVPVDEALFKRALSNLLGNAERYAEHGSTVVVRISAELAQGPEQVQVVVQNRGPSIAPAQLPRLFDRFFRGDESRCCPQEQHHGLGLAIVAAIARMHAGRTLAESAGGITRVGFTLATR
ncbi:MAG: heavy metal sensor histidine kinase [Rubrivivax sp.]|nr:heavy metal sensor histidine kinase [Rubrivivax sp.]